MRYKQSGCFDGQKLYVERTINDFRWGKMAPRLLLGATLELGLHCSLRYDCSIFRLTTRNSGPSCSKLTTSLVNDSLKFTLSDTQIC